ncbi:hypothetical protein O3G_MSEX004879 [Manduca sexta]|uniref:Uncharacterized protein n=1 Tax=Manduca sexta TaxID=7130 RepID=A0A921YWF2_MANSE|nr:hypothetical protein O3G_MSEX004879 [Manduca sexta]
MYKMFQTWFRTLPVDAGRSANKSKSIIKIVTSKDLTSTHQVNIQLSQSPIPTYNYPYQEDFTSTVKFLNEETPNKKSKVGNLIKLLKKVLTKYIDVLKDEKTDSDGNITIEDTQEVKKEFIKRENTITEKKEEIVLKENDNETIQEVRTENIIEIIYDIDNNTIETQKELAHKLNNVPEERIKTSVISVTDFFEDDPINYMRNFRPKPDFYQSQQDSYVLERPEPKIMETFDSQVEKVVKIGKRERNRNVPMKNKRNHLKKAPFSIPCVKASDILDESLHVTKDPYFKNKPRIDMNSIVQDIQSTIENPVSNYISICSEPDHTVAMLFKPKTISLMQAYGNLLKKITVTVLVPFHVSKLML